MALQNIVETSKIIDAISGLEIASNAHIEWLKNFHRIIVCGLPFDSALGDPNADKKCFFGKWYHGKAREITIEPHLFQQIGEAHHDFHRLASEILQRIGRQEAVEEGKYDEFMNTVVRFNDHLRHLQSELWNLVSSSDPLTGLPSWHRLLAPIDGLVEGKNHKAVQACAAMCDIDYFKKVNDTHGHQAGDAVLRRVGQTLQDGVRPSDMVYRYGGEEFLIHLAGASMDEASMVCERLRQAVESLAVTVPGLAEPIGVTASFGISEATKGLTIEEVVGHCDVALYAAKGNGRNRVYIWRAGELAEFSHGAPVAAFAR